jgi:predicted amidophosphoribosyltransferase
VKGWRSELLEVTASSWRWGLDLLMPPECVWCGLPVGAGHKLCDACSPVFTRRYTCCWRCAMPLPPVVDPRSCMRCREADWKFERVIALGAYRGRLREAVLLVKKPHYEALGVAVGELLGRKLAAELQSGSDMAGVVPLLVPVPNHWTRRMLHRTSTAETLARSIATITGWPMRTGCVRRVRRTAKQGLLAWSHRRDNVRGAFSVTAQLAERTVLIVDDVFTSGSTAAELTVRLRQAGAARVLVACIARGTGTRDAVPVSEPRLGGSQRSKPL